MSLHDRIASDLDKFVDQTLLGKSATYTPAAGSPSTTIEVLFFDATQARSDFDGSIIDTGPMALAKTADVINAGLNDTLVIDGETYFVLSAKPGSSGETELALSLRSVA